MIHAELHGKLPEVHAWEDLLTSSVFGLLRYVAPEVWWPALLADLARRNHDAIVPIDPRWNGVPRSVDVRFWERWRTLNAARFVEPDVVMDVVLEDGTPGVVAWEAKYHAPLGPLQLERELQALLEVYRDWPLRLLVHVAAPGTEAFSDFLAQRREPAFHQRAVADRVPALHYTWTWLTELLSPRYASGSLPLNDLVAYLGKKGFDGFRGFGASANPEVTRSAAFRFTPRAGRLRWPIEPGVDPNIGGYRWTS